jgi:hypothetical protein
MSYEVSNKRLFLFNYFSIHWQSIPLIENKFSDKNTEGGKPKGSPLCFSTKSPPLSNPQCLLFQLKTKPQWL